MIVEVLNTGSELLLGQVLNTHLKYLAETIFPLGLRISRQVTVPDGTAIREALAETFGRADIVLVTGGLGPTTDDITREVTAELLGLDLVHDESIMQAIVDRFARRGLKLTDRTGRQAQRPREAVVLPNNNGTAPGLYLAPREVPAGVADPGYSARTPHIFLLPGPPRELKPMVEESVLPILRQIVPLESGISMRCFRIGEVGESLVEEKVGEALLALGIELGYCARPGEVDVRTIGTAVQVQIAESIIIEHLGPHIVSQDNRSLEKVLVDLLTSRGETIAVAESCTGGYLAHCLTNVPGASNVFLQGFVTYANEAKTRALGVDENLIREHGAVSHQVAAAMAKGAMQASGATYALATTGIAGPGGGTPEKPVGTVYIALATRHGKAKVERHFFPTDRETFKDLVLTTAFNLLRRELTDSRS
ncbi:CinA family nicotinamide mononucleotide deamidase-related protein [Verrucomicrobiota bacterium sgz303538]